MTHSPKNALDVPLTDIDILEAGNDPPASSLEAPQLFTKGQQTLDKTLDKKLLRKLDLHLIPFLALIYLLCFLDRTNVGNARLFGLEKDLHMEGLDYNIALAIFFPFYILTEIPSIAEGGLFPGANYFITMWYQRHECGFRMALFFSAATAAGAFGGLFARGISEMSGLGNKAGWSWIFIIEGLFTLCVACGAYWAINDYPATTKFLTPAEKSEVQRRLIVDKEYLSDDFDLKYVWQAFRDWKIWVNMLIACGIFTALYSISLFLPTIIKDLGYSNNTAQLMTVPPYVLACMLTIGGSYAADKVKQRGIFLLVFELLAIAGFVMLLASDEPHIKYVGTFLAAGGIYPLIPLIGAWNSNNIGGSLKRGVGIAMQTGFGNLGGVIASFIYLTKDAPRKVNYPFTFRMKLIDLH
ncbi:hypothetical protein B7494_g5265 [Chlorociboria aeruginascens]|nr:hypothetical protein B7494_g5265 [Chlorociboria aeruginascens]